MPSLTPDRSNFPVGHDCVRGLAWWYRRFPSELAFEDARFLVDAGLVATHCAGFPRPSLWRIAFILIEQLNVNLLDGLVLVAKVLLVPCWHVRISDSGLQDVVGVLEELIDLLPVDSSSPSANVPAVQH